MFLFSVVVDIRCGEFGGADVEDLALRLVIRLCTSTDFEDPLLTTNA